MAPKKPTYNSALTRANNARDSLLAPTGGIPEYDATTFEYPYATPLDAVLRKYTQGDEAPSEVTRPPLLPPSPVLETAAATVPSPPPPLPAAPKSDVTQYAKGAPFMVDEGILEGMLPGWLSWLNKSESAEPLQPPQIKPTVATKASPPPPSLPLRAPETTAVPPPSIAETAAVAPPTATEATTPAAPQEDRLTQLARIVSMTQTPESPESMQRAASDDALSKIQAAMYAGLTRTPVPQSVFTPFTPPTGMSRLDQLYKASQILGKPGVGPTGKYEKLAGPLLKERLKRFRPDVWKTLQDSNEIELLTESDVKSYLGMEQRSDEQAAREKAEQAKQERLTKQFEDKMAVGATTALSAASKRVEKLVPMFAPLKRILDNKDTLKSAFNPGSQLRKKLLGGALSSQDEQSFNSFVESVVSPIRNALYGAQLTSQELDRYDTMMGQGAFKANPKLQLAALRQVVEGVQNVFANTWEPFRNAKEGSELQEQFLAYEESKQFTENNPLFDAFYKEIDSLLESMPNEVSVVESLKSVPKAVGNVLSGELVSPTAPKQKPSAAAPTLSPEQKRKRLEELRKRKAAGEFD